MSFSRLNPPAINKIRGTGRFKGFTIPAIQCFLEPPIGLINGFLIRQLAGDSIRHPYFKHPMLFGIWTPTQGNYTSANHKAHIPLIESKQKDCKHAFIMNKLKTSICSY